MKDLKNGSGLTGAFTVLEGMVNARPPSMVTHDEIVAALIRPSTPIQRVKFRGTKVIVTFAIEDLLKSTAERNRAREGVINDFW